MLAANVWYSDGQGNIVPKGTEGATKHTEGGATKKNEKNCHPWWAQVCKHDDCPHLQSFSPVIDFDLQYRGSHDAAEADWSPPVIPSESVTQFCKRHNLTKSHLSEVIWRRLTCNTARYHR